eukprot:SAG31_NODE_2817_length_5042_cov_32.133522_6_plen_368_part_00
MLRRRAAETAAASVAGGRGRGRGATLPAWKTAGDGSLSSAAGTTHGGPRAVAVTAALPRPTASAAERPHMTVPADSDLPEDVADWIECSSGFTLGVPTESSMDCAQATIKPKQNEKKRHERDPAQEQHNQQRPAGRMFLSPDAYFDGCRKANRLVHLGKYTQCYKCWQKYSTWPENEESGEPTYWVHKREGGATTATTTCQWRKEAGVWTRQQHGDTDGTNQRVLFAAPFEERSWAKPSPTDTSSPAVQPCPRQPDPQRPEDGWNAPATRAGMSANDGDGWGSSTGLPPPSNTGQRGRQAETATARRTASESNKVKTESESPPRAWHPPCDTSPRSPDTTQRMDQPGAWDRLDWVPDAHKIQYRGQN